MIVIFYSTTGRFKIFFSCLLYQPNEIVFSMNTVVYLKSATSAEDKATILDVFRTFVNALDAYNVTYFMYGGTLLGSYRHHGLVPWDDDVDVIIDGDEKAKAREALSKVDQTRYALHDVPDTRYLFTQWKFFSKDLARSHGFPHKSFRWPYIDVFFFSGNATHIWDAEPQYSSSFLWTRSVVFPLHRRPFEDLSVLAPCDTHAFLAHNYDLDVCMSLVFDHQREIPRWGYSSVACSDLHAVFPFVFRSPVSQATKEGAKVNETLKISDWTLRSLILPSGCQTQG